MKFADLTQAQKNQLTAFMNVFRPLMGDTARLFAQLQRLEDAWGGQGGVGNIIASLDANEVIDTPTVLIGVGELTKENLTNTMTDFQMAIAGFYADSNRQAYIRAAGLPNLI